MGSDFIARTNMLHQHVTCFVNDTLEIILLSFSHPHTEHHGDVHQGGHDYYLVNPGDVVEHRVAHEMILHIFHHVAAEGSHLELARTVTISPEVHGGHRVRIDERHEAHVQDDAGGSGLRRTG
jgi:hypothetical protein